jgi:hypothetical protein
MMSRGLVSRGARVKNIGFLSVAVAGIGAVCLCAPVIEEGEECLVDLLAVGPGNGVRATVGDDELYVLDQAG